MEATPTPTPDPRTREGWVRFDARVAEIVRSEGVSRAVAGARATGEGL